MTVFSSSINEATSSRGVGVWGTVIYWLYSKNGGGSGAGGGGKTLINLHQNIASRYWWFRLYSLGFFWSALGALPVRHFRIHKIGATISGIAWEDKRYLWLVNGCLEYHRLYLQTIPEIVAPKSCTHSSRSFWGGELKCTLTNKNGSKKFYCVCKMTFDASVMKLFIKFVVE